MPAAMLLLAIQSGPAGIEAVDYVLPPPARSERILQDCRREVASDEIVVCGRGGGVHRYGDAAPPAGMPIDRALRIGVDLGGARLEPQLEQVQFDNGMISRRVKVTLKVPF